MNALQIVSYGIGLWILGCIAVAALYVWATRGYRRSTP